MTTIEELISEKEELERLVVKLAAENQQLKDEISEKKANDILFAESDRAMAQKPKNGGKNQHL